MARTPWQRGTTSSNTILMAQGMAPRLRLREFFSRPFFRDYRVLLGLWVLLAIVAGLIKTSNNFLIFRYVFWHTIHEQPLFAQYPEYWDVNHYGPLFSLVIAPFAVVPVWLGELLWVVALAVVLWWAVRRLPVQKRVHVFIYWYCAHELLTALFMCQFNIAIAAIILGTFILLEREREPWAAFLIVLGTLVKLYGIVGLAFFFFSKHRWRFVLWLALWSVVLFVAPMAISSPAYVVGQYIAWYEELVVKNSANLFSYMQNVSLLGIVRKVSGCATYSDLWLIAGGLVLFGLPYLRISQYRHLPFRLGIVASVLLFVVLFSTGSESSSYIIALVGVSLWYAAVPWRRGRWDLALLIFVFILTSMSPSDLFPAYIRKTWVQPYALKALPCVLVWFRLTWELLVRDWGTQHTTSSLPENAALS